MRLVTDTFAYCRDRVRAGTRSRSPATTCAKPAAPRCRKVPSRWRTGCVTAGGAGRRPRRRPLRSAACRSSSRAQRPHRGGREVPRRAAPVARNHARALSRARPAAWRSDSTPRRRSMLTAQQPENNIVRVAVQALAAVLGGCQSLHTTRWTRRSRCPPSRRRPDRAADAADPRAQSGWRGRRSARRRFAVERLTGEIEEAARVYIQKIDDLGARSSPSRSCSARSRRRPTAIKREIEDQPGSSSASTSSSRTSRRPATSSRWTRRRPGARRARGPHTRRARSRGGRAALDALESGARGAPT